MALIDGLTVLLETIWIAGMVLAVLIGIVWIAGIAVLVGRWCRSLWCWCWRRESPKPSPPPEPRWAHLLNREDVVVLDTRTTGLDADAEVTDAAVINTHGQVLIHDLWASAVRALPPDRVLLRPRYHDVLGPLMRVLKRASVICVYNADFDIPLIQRQVARHGRDATLDAKIVCIQRGYARHYTPDGTWLKLGEAARREFVLNEVGEPHPPLNDVRLTLGIMCKVVARERRARGLPIGDALAPNYSGISLAHGTPEKTEPLRIRQEPAAPDPAGRPTDTRRVPLRPHSTKSSTPAALKSVDDDEVLRDLAGRRGLKPGQNWARQ